MHHEYLLLSGMQFSVHNATMVFTLLSAQSVQRI